MESRIGHLHYRVRTARGTRVPAGLEQIARERVGDALGEALDAALGEDPGVYVLRGVRADLPVDLAVRQSDREVAESWAGHLAAAITRAIAEEGEEDVARFADEAEFIARFATDLADGVAWERWFYGAFAELRPLGRRAALRAVLLDHREQLAAILAWLARHGSLERVLACLDARALAALQPRRAEPELVRPLLAAALRVVDALGAARGSRPSMGELLARYLAVTGRVPSWRDRRALAEGVLDALEFLVRERIVDFRDQPQPPARERLAPLRAELDWLDVERLEDGLSELAGPAARLTGSRPVSSARSQRELALLGELGPALSSAPVTLDVREPASGANALRIAAALAGRLGGGAGERAAAAAIAHLLDAVGRLVSDRVAPEVWALIAAGDEAGAWRRYRAAGGPAEDVELLAAASAVVRCFAPADSGVAESHAGHWIESPCAGALLPLRAAFDLALPALAAAAGAPQVSELLLAITLRLEGAPAASQPIDAGLAAALAFAEPPTPETLGEAWANVPPRAHHRLRDAIADSLAARGLTAAGDDALASGTLGDCEADLTIGRAAGAILSAWAQWLRGFADSTVPFLLDRFVRRPGTVSLQANRAIVELERRPLDVVLEMAGYLDELDSDPYLPRRIGFVLTRD